MNRPRGKRRSIAQRIGDQGEHLFAAWATTRGLSPNKVGADLGVDFFCEVLARGGRRVEEATGATLSVQVRSTEGAGEPKVRLTREDVENLVRQLNATCVVGVHVTTKTIRFLFLEGSTVDLFLDFLASTRKYLSITYDEMQVDESVFDVKVRQLSRPGTRQALRMLISEKRLQQLIPGLALSAIQSTRHSALVVEMPWIGTAFAAPSGDEGEIVRTLVLERGAVPNPAAMRLLPRFDLEEIADLTDGQLFLGGGHEEDVELWAESQGRREKTTFVLRRLGDEQAYFHPVGLCLISSAARARAGQWVHDMEGRIIEGKSLGECEQSLPFLRLLDDHCQIGVSSAGNGIDINHWGELARTATVVDDAEVASPILGIALGDIRLVDFCDEEFSRSFWFIANVARENVGIQSMMGGFCQASIPASLAGIVRKTAEIDLPVVFRVRARAYVAWIKIAGDALFEGNAVVGFTFEKQLAYRVESLADPVDKTTLCPEMHIAESWGPIPLGSDKPLVAVNGTARFTARLKLQGVPSDP